MVLDVFPITWVRGLLGGLLIGLAAASFLLVNGRIMGASGILADIVDGAKRTNGAERLAFLGGLVALPMLLVAMNGPSATHLTGNVSLLAAGGVLVGLGTRMANGCTSGHGVCGLARFSTRSMVATVAFLLAGFATMFVGRHLLGVF